MAKKRPENPVAAYRKRNLKEQRGGMRQYSPSEKSGELSMLGKILLVIAVIALIVIFYFIM